MDDLAGEEVLTGELVVDLQKKKIIEKFVSIGRFGEINCEMVLKFKFHGSFVKIIHDKYGRFDLNVWFD